MVHTSRLLSLSEDLPLAIVIFDHSDRIRVLPQLDELISGGLVRLWAPLFGGGILDEVSVIKYVGRHSVDDRR